MDIFESIKEVQTKFGAHPPSDSPSDEGGIASSFVRAKERALNEAAVEAAAAAAADASDRAAADEHKQALYDTLYLVAAADGSVSGTELGKLAVGVRELLGDGFDEADIAQGLQRAATLRDGSGLKGAAESIAGRIGDSGERHALLFMASTVAWLGGGVGTKEGLALQAIAAAFSIPINELHKQMAVAARVAKL